ncbi:MAG: hypothetical protein LQ350_004164 [Teloschistes chrysophthalmus]|nr:MAG: hypothetical protein LQ350_004164 [Niorma chrysophthalma]
MKSASLLFVNSADQQQGTLVTSLQSQAQEMNKLTLGHSYRGMDKEALKSHGQASLQAIINHPEAIHEIGLTLDEVHEVLRRRASLHLDAYDQDDLFVSENSHLSAAQELDVSRQRKQEVRSSGIFSMCYHPFESIVTATMLSTQHPVLPFHASQRSTIGKNGTFPSDRNYFRLPITPRRPSTTSSASSVSRTTPTTAFLIDDSKASTPASSLDGSFHGYIPQLDVGMIDRLMSDIEDLQRRVSVLEDKSRKLEEEVRVWKDLAAKETRESAQ